MKRLSILSLLMLLVIKLHPTNIIIKDKVSASKEIKIDKFLDLNVKTDTSLIKIINNYSDINSISELLDIFKGKSVFIDLWATWCSPCIQEFKFSNSLYDFLNKNRVEIIYVSFDKGPSDILWRNMIQEYKLSGNHVKACKRLRDDFTTLIWGGIDVSSIPHYLLFDKNKSLINKCTSHPSSGQKLFKEIEMALK